MSSTTTTTTTTPPNLSSLGHHVASHILSVLQNAQYLSSKVLTKKSLFTSKEDFRAALKDPFHICRDDLELCIYNYQALYECLGKRMMTPWAFLASRQRYHFPVMSDWVFELNGPEKRDMRNLIAHTFNTGTAYRDIGGYLESRDEGDGMCDRTFSAGRFWELLEKELGPLVKELGYAVETFSEQVKDMPVEVRVKVEVVVVVEDMSTPEIPPEWNQGDAADWDCAESSGTGWEHGVAETWDSPEVDIDDIILAFEKLSVVEEDEGYESEEDT